MGPEPTIPRLRITCPLTKPSRCLSLNFCLSYCCLHYWRTVLPDTEFLVDISSLSTLNTSVHYFLVPMILYEKSIVSLIKDPLYARSHYSCCCFQDFLFVFGFWQLTIMCLIVGLFEIKLLGARWVSWIYRFISFTKFYTFWSLFLQIFFLPLPFSLLHLGLP